MVTRTKFGETDEGPVELITLASGGIEARIMTYGAGIQAMLVPDRGGQIADVALGHATLRPYRDQPQYIGATVGRYANRIAGGRFRLDDIDYQVPANNGPNALHGGPRGFDKRNWAVLGTGASEVTLSLASAHGDQGFPGALTVTATYRLSAEGELSVEYRATTDAATIINISNHAYWNLAGEGSADGAMGHRLTIPANAYLPTDVTAIPTGEVRDVTGTAFDFRQPRAVGERVREAGEEQIRFGRGYDHNWIISREATAEPRMVARVEEPVSGRAMELWSDQPGLQFYSGNFLDGTSFGKAGQLYRMGDAFVLEPQLFPDTPNQPAFGSARLNPGETYRNRIAWRFSTI